MNILKISFQYSTYNRKETPFRSEMDNTTSSKQTRSSYVRKEIKTLVIFRALFAYVSPESIRTRECSRIILYCFFLYNNQINAPALIGQSAMVYCASKQWKNRASSELLSKSNRPQVSMVYRLISHLGC